MILLEATAADDAGPTIGPSIAAQAVLLLRPGLLPLLAVSPLQYSSCAVQQQCPFLDPMQACPDRKRQETDTAVIQNKQTSCLDHPIALCGRPSGALAWWAFACMDPPAMASRLPMI